MMFYIGLHNVAAMRRNSGRMYQRSAEAFGWMYNFFNQTCEKSPMSIQWYLPCFLTKLAVFKLYKSDLKGSCEIISKSQFHHLWMTKFKHVTIPKVYF